MSCLGLIRDTKSDSDEFVRRLSDSEDSEAKAQRVKRVSIEQHVSILKKHANQVLIKY